MNLKKILIVDDNELNIENTVLRSKIKRLIKG